MTYRSRYPEHMVVCCNVMHGHFFSFPFIILYLHGYLVPLLYTQQDPNAYTYLAPLLYTQQDPNAYTYLYKILNYLFRLTPFHKETRILEYMYMYVILL